MSQRPARRAPSFLQARARAAKLPEAFDWSNASGSQDWLEPVMDQGSCGSCYAASSMRMLSVRHKIKQNDQSALPWSINLPLHCGEYNQGCKGGYGSLISKWSEDVGLLPATCMRYDTEGSCKLECDLDKLEGKRFRAANHRLIGNWYGNSSTQAMMEEIYYNGPIVVSFEPAEDFMFYSDGVYKSAGKAAGPISPRVEKPWTKVATRSWRSAGAWTTGRSTGASRTVGARTGARTASSAWRATRTTPAWSPSRRPPMWSRTRRTAGECRSSSSSCGRPPPRKDPDSRGGRGRPSARAPARPEDKAAARRAEPPRPSPA